jgi:hypothetical protein
MGDPIQLNGDNVTANYFHLLGRQTNSRPALFAEEEMKADVAVISEHFWRTKLARDSNVLGRSLTLNGVPTTIVGVIPTMPISWFGPELEIWTVKPFDLPGTPKELLMRGVSFLRVIGRLKPGVTLEQAKANLLAVQESYHQQNAEKADNTWQPVLVTAPEDATGQLRPAFLTLLGAVAFVLLIACSNVANLLLVAFHRTPARDRVARCPWCVARQRRALICHRKPAAQSHRWRPRDFVGALGFAARAETWRSKRAA